IYWAKLAWAVVVILASAVWMAVLAIIASIASAGVLVNHPLDIFGGIAYVAGQIVAVTPWWGWVAGPPVVLVLLMFTVLQFFFAASIGSEKRVNSLGPGGPIVVWILLYVVLQIFTFA